MGDREDVEALAARLELDPDYRVLRRIRDVAPDPAASPTSWPIATIVDVETTGRDPARDRVVELGMLSFRYDPLTGEVGAPVAAGSWLQDPGVPIPAEMTAIHGIGDADVAGRSIDREAAADLLAASSLAIAHKAAFDRPFVHGLDVGAGDLAWVCSLRDVSWQARGFDGSSLHPLAAQAGLFSERHRCAADCAVLHALLAFGRSGEAGPGRPRVGGLMDDLHRAASRIDVLLFAEGAAYAHKDALRMRGYRWNDGVDGRPKAWWKALDEAGADAEEAFLHANYVRATGRRLFRDHVDAYARYRSAASD